MPLQSGFLILRLFYPLNTGVKETCLLTHGYHIFYLNVLFVIRSKRLTQTCQPLRVKKLEVGSRNLKIESWKSEVGSQKSEDPPRLSYATDFVLLTNTVHRKKNYER